MTQGAGRGWPGLAVAAAACAGCIFILGWTAGDRSLVGYAVFWGAALAAILAAWRAAAAGPDVAHVSDRVIRAAVLVVAVAVGSVMLAGAARHLTLLTVLGVELALCVGLWMIARPPASTDSSTAAPPIPIMALAIIAALAAFAVSYGAAHAPSTLYDSLSYHLYFSARWVQDRAVSIVPTPFSDEAQAYAPANGELYFAWLMLPFHSDVLARMGQLPFAALGGASIYGLARRLGAPPSHAVYPAALFLAARPVIEQMIGADVDLICAALFVTTVYLAVTAIDRDRVRDWLLVGVSAGLFFGTKYVALVYAPALLFVVLARGVRPRALWMIPGIAAFALPWYLRNWAVAGSPIYPATLSLGGVTVARGAFSRRAMLDTVFHTRDLRLFPIIAAHAIGPTLLFAVPLVVAGWIAMTRRSWWPHRALALLPVLMLPLFWYGFPVNIDSRFLMPAVAPALVPVAFAFPRQGWGLRAVQAWCLAGLCWVVVGMRADIPSRAPWFMSGWLALDGLVHPQFLVWFAVVALAVAGAWTLSRRSGRLAGVTMITVLCGATSGLAAAGPAWCDGACDYLDVTPTYIRQQYIDAWRWVAAHVSNSTIAYTGINLPYPLTGNRLANRVVYVNIDAHTRWRFDNYARAYHTGHLPQEGPLLATSSGELLPAASPADALRPRYERLNGDRTDWIGNLKAMGVQHVFVAQLSAYEIDDNWHDDQGFPIENAWAAGDPARFRLEYENARVRIYAINPFGDRL